MILTPFQTIEKKENFSGLGFSNIWSIKKKAQLDLIKDLKKDEQALQEYADGVGSATNKSEFFEQTLGKASKQAQDFAPKIVAGTDSVEGFKRAQTAAATATKSVGIASKAATVGVKALNIAMNVGVTVLASIAIQKTIEWINDLATSQQRAIETANELTTAYKQNVDSAKSNISTLEGLKNEFNKLSKGVDTYGNNVGLSTEEYKRYKEIVEQIVGISPSLQTGYDKEGKAIADNNGLVERSIELEKEKIRIEKEKLVSDDDLWTKAQGTIGNYNKQLDSVNQKLGKLGTGISSNLSSGMQNSADKYKEFLSVFKLDDSKLDKASLYNQQGYITQLLRDTENLKKVADTLKQNPLLLSQYINTDGIEKVRNELTEYTQSVSELDTESKKLNPTLQIIPETLSAYDKLNDAQKNFLTDYINEFTEADINTKEKLENVKQSIKDMTDSLANNSEAKNAINQLFSIDKTKLSALDYKTQINNLINEIAKILKLDANKLKIMLKFDVDSKNIDKMLSDLDKKVKPEAKSFVKSLSIDDLKIAYKIENIGNMSPSELANAISKIKSVADQATNSTNKLADSMSEIQEKASIFESVKKDVSDYGTISLENLQKIIDKYPELETVVAQYQAGIISTSGLMSILQGKYQEDENAYKQAILNKLFANDQFYSETILKNSKFVNEFKRLYGVDLTNYKNLAQAKSEVDNKLLRDLINNWSRFYNAQTNAFTEDYAKLGMSAGQGNKESLAKLKIIESEVGQYRKAIDSLNKISLNGVNFKTSNSLSNDTKKQKSSAKSAESAAKKAEDALKKQYEAELKLIETNKSLGKYDKDRMSYYNALSALQNKWAKSKLDNETKQELSVKVHEALKNYQQGTLDLSLKELDTRIKLGKIEENSPQHLQNLLEIQNNLIHGNLQLINTDENRLALQEKIYDVNKAMLENENKKLQDTESAVENIADKHIKDIQKREEAIDKHYQRRIDKAQKHIDDLKEREEKLEERYKIKIDPIQEKIDALQKINEEHEKEIALEKAKAAFEAAQNQKTVSIFRRGQGFVYEADTDAINTAKENLANAKRDKQVFDLTQQKEALEKELENEKQKLEDSIKYWEDYQKDLEKTLKRKKEDLEEDIENWEDYKEQWAAVAEDYKYQQDLLLISENLGAQAEAEILAQRLGVVDNFKNKYISLQREMATYAEKMLNSAEKAKQAREAIVKLKGNSSAKFSHYATGIDKVPYNQIANVDDGNGEELILHPQQGRLTSLEYGDKVYNGSETKNILDTLASATNPQMLMLKNMQTPSNLNSISRNNTKSYIKLSIGDINLQGVKDVNGLSKAIVDELPNQILQDLFKKK